jgi:nucleoside-diphosphate-sugar epimerase
VNKILLTGSTGFIGSALVKNLSQNNKIYVILRTKKKIKISNNINKIFFTNYSELDKKIKKIKVDVIIHCATHYVKSHKINDLEKLSNSNILLGNILLDNLITMKVKKFINFTTVWENYDGKKNNFFNLYSAYKKAFSHLINYYDGILKNVKFYNLTISDTFGEQDKRKKIINILKINYKKNLITKIVSKNLFLNLLNVEDIINAVKIILNNKSKPGSYLLKNSKNYSISEIVNKINKDMSKKIKVAWLSKKIIKEKIYKQPKLQNWFPKKSKLKNLLEIITK